MKNWWKILCVVLLAYTIGMGLLVPLSPGITAISPETLDKGREMEVSISGFNTHFREAGSSLKAWVKGGDELYCCDYVILSDLEMYIAVMIPAAAQHYSYDLIVNNDIDGTIYFANSIHAQTGADSAASAQTNTCTYEVKHEHASFLSFPNREMLFETIRNLYFHVPMWFAMITMVFVSIIGSIMHLRMGKMQFDNLAEEAVRVGIAFGIFGLITGSIWARFTWGTWWTNDTKLNGSAATMLVYFAYVLLRNSMDDEIKRARIAAVYNIFAFTLMIVFIGILPRISDSLHPGNGGNPAFGKYDLDNTMKMVFYPAVIGWILLSVWILDIRIRIRKLES